MFAPHKAAGSDQFPDVRPMRAVTYVRRSGAAMSPCTMQRGADREGDRLTIPNPKLQRLAAARIKDGMMRLRIRARVQERQ